MKIVGIRVFNCHLSGNWRHIAIENTLSSYFAPSSLIVNSLFNYRPSGVVLFIKEDKLKKIVGSNNFSAQFIKIISHYKKSPYLCFISLLYLDLYKCMF